MDKLTHWRKCDKTDFLGAVDLEELLNTGQTDLLAVIEKVEIKEVKVRGKKGEFRIATFTDKKIKPMLLNVGNAKIIKGFSGNKKHVEEWVNIPISLYIQENVKFGSEYTEALRIRPVMPKQKPELVPGHKKWDDAKEAAKNGKLQSVKSRYVLTPENEKLLLS